MMEPNRADIEYEVREQLNFKFDALEAGIKNRIGFHTNVAFSSLLEHSDAATSQQHQHYREAFTEFLSMIQKERHMPIPEWGLGAAKIAEAKNKAVDDIMNTLDRRFRGTHQFDGPGRHTILQAVVRAVESAQI